MRSLISSYEHVNIYQYQVLHENFCLKCWNFVTMWQDHMDKFNLFNETFGNL